MNRERAEIHLRLLAEAQMRDPGPRFPETPYAPLPTILTRVAWALTTVDALDIETAEGILADFEVALAVRRGHVLARPFGMRKVGMAWISGPAGLGPRRFPGLSPLRRMSRVMPGAIAAGPLPAVSAPAAGPRAASRGTAERYVPVGQMILFHDQTISGELDLMSYAHTASGARLVATWQARDPLGARRQGLPPVDRFAVTDDRGNRYNLGFSTKGQPEWSCDLSLDPDPPEDIRWLEVTAPGETAIRIHLHGQGPGSTERAVPEVTKIDLTAGEHLLNRIAERLLTLAQEYPQDLRLLLAPASPGPLTELAAGLGDMVAALEAAEALSPLSPVPGRLAALCASLRVGRHGITAAPALDLPEPWLSLLTHYHRRRPDTAPPRDGFAAVAAALPELDGIGLVLLGLHNSDGGTWMNALALGQMPGNQHGPLGLEESFPLSVWIRDSAGRWHAARPAGWYDDDGEYVLTLQLVPPLPRSADWIEVLAAGRSAEARVELPLRWGYPP
jgi:hypothetical protein